MTINCPQCHHANSDDAEFCENCGAQLPVSAAASFVNPNSVAGANAAPAAHPASTDPQLVCPQCKAPLVPGDEFCFNCGTDVRHLKASPGASPVQPVSSVGQPPNGANPPNNQNNPNVMSDNDILKQLAELDGSATLSPAQSAPANLSAVGPVAQPAVAAPQTPSPAPVAGNVSGGSIPVSPGPAGGVAGNAFGAPVSGGISPMAVATEALSKSGAAKVAGKLKLQITGPQGEQVVEWTDHEILLGRNDPKTRVFPDVNLDDSAASRRHLAIWKEAADGFYYAQDLESANGTSLNGQDLKPGEPTEIHDGDEMNIGTRYNIKVQIS